jgi:hypothetical protein
MPDDPAPIDLQTDELELNLLADSLIADARRRRQEDVLKKLCLRVVKRLVYTQPDNQPADPA